jgi:hypothetical protein
MKAYITKLQEELPQRQANLHIYMEDPYRMILLLESIKVGY